jgi:ATP-dependent Clp protease protease subunit
MMPTEINRKIVISQPITDHLAGDVIAQILEINDYDAEMAGVLANYEVKPIEMFINSGGGSASAGFAIIGAMELSDTPIVTYGFGMVASMALGIFVAGDIRMAHRFTRFMFHSVAYGNEGHIQDHIDGIKEVKVVQKMYNSLFKDRTKFPPELITEIIERKKDYFFSGKKAVDYGVADDLMLKPEQKIQLVSEEEAMAIMAEVEADVYKK